MVLWHWRRRSASVAVVALMAVAACATQTVVAEGDLHLEEDYHESSCQQTECLRCDLSTGRCLKCLYVMVESGRLCSSSCPAGSAPVWRQDHDYQGTVCAPGSLLSAITGRDIAVIGCAAAGGAVCVGIILGAIIYARRQAMLKPGPDEGGSRKIHVPRMWKDHRPSAADTCVSVEERREFLQTLASVRKDVPLLLEMLAETRARFRGIKGPDHTMDTKARAYRAVVRDLNRVVGLVSRRDESFHCVPGDWRRLLAWADRLLMRYRRTRESKCAGCEHQHHHPLPSPKAELSPDFQVAASPSSQPLFQTRQQAQEERWRKQRAEAAKGGPGNCPTKLCWTDVEAQDVEKGSTNTGARPSEDSEKSPSDNLSHQVSSKNYFSLSPTIIEEVLHEEEAALDFELQFCKVDPHDIEISYSKDEEALAHQRAHGSVMDENLKNDIKTSNVNFDTVGAANKAKKEKGSPSMITRIFCNKLLSNTDFSLNSDLDDLHKPQKTNDVNILHDEECMSSTSIYDHIEAFTFDDFSAPTKPEVKPTNSKPKPKTTANVNINRLRKPNFPSYSESFKQILDKRNLLTIQKSKIQKRLSRRGEQLNKMVRRSESRFLKDRNKLKPNMTYDRRNCKNDVVNQEMVGGDVYVSVVKQPVVERDGSHHSGSYVTFEGVDDDANTERERSSVEGEDDRAGMGSDRRDRVTCGLESYTVEIGCDRRDIVTCGFDGDKVEGDMSGMVTCGLETVVNIPDDVSGNNIRCELLTMV